MDLDPVLLSRSMGVVTGIVMAFQFGTHWGVLAERMGSIQGPLLGREAFTAFMLEASFFGVMLLGRARVAPRLCLFACCRVALGTRLSSFWIMANNRWIQLPVGHAIERGRIVPADWWAIVAGSAFDGLAPFPLLTGIGLVLGHVLLGAGRLLMKCAGAVQQVALRRIPLIADAMSVVLALAFGLTLGTMDWPYMVPYSITIADAATAEASLSFLFWGAGLFVLPVIAVYTIGMDWVFRGKTREGRCEGRARPIAPR